MERIEVKNIKDVELENPVLVEGLPGIGHVGKLVAEHIIDELGAEKIAEVYSSHFPPQVIVLADGLVRMVRSEFYAVKSEKQDLLILVGDHQSATNEGDSELTDAYLE
ncbi:MAG: PAC2 family protein, partial [Euryarchaeota archaeon]|nr:PAC2 family protein [Euryarchaeota archaeon]